MERQEARIVERLHIVSFLEWYVSDVKLSNTQRTVLSVTELYVGGVLHGTSQTQTNCCRAICFCAAKHHSSISVGLLFRLIRVVCGGICHTSLDKYPYRSISRLLCLCQSFRYCYCCCYIGVQKSCAGIIAGSRLACYRNEAYFAITFCKCSFYSIRFGGVKHVCHRSRLGSTVYIKQLVASEFLIKLLYQPPYKGLFRFCVTFLFGFLQVIHPLQSVYIVRLCGGCSQARSTVGYSYCLLQIAVGHLYLYPGKRHNTYCSCFKLSLYAVKASIRSAFLLPAGCSSSFTT